MFMNHSAMYIHYTRLNLGDSYSSIAVLYAENPSIAFQSWRKPSTLYENVFHMAILSIHTRFN